LEKKQALLSGVRAVEPHVVKATVSFVSPCDAGVPLELALPSLKVMQNGIVIGELSSPSELAGLPSRMLQSLRLILVGSLTSKNQQPAEVQVRFFNTVKGGPAVLDMCVCVKVCDVFVCLFACRGCLNTPKPNRILTLFRRTTWRWKIV
jgi:hypothetical protein